MRSDVKGAESVSAKSRILPWLLGVTLPLYVIDQITKFWTIGRFSEPVEVPGQPGVYYFGTSDKPIEVIEGFFWLTRVHNQGVAFGMGNGTDWAPLVFPFISLTAFVLIGLGLKKNFFYGKLGMLSVALLLCGIIGNLTDRLIQGSLLERMKGAPLWERLKEGYVVDFLDFKLPLYDKLVPSSGGHWPVFNVADSCICVAAVLLFVSGWREEKAKSGAGR